jgi:hypothetical protein
MTAPLTTADLSRIEALARAATPGERVVRLGTDCTGKDTYCDGIYVGPIPVEDGQPEWWDAVNLVTTDVGFYPPKLPDAEFIAALDPDTVLALVEAARKLERVETAARELFARLQRLKGPTFREALASHDPEDWGITNPWCVAEGQIDENDRVPLDGLAAGLFEALHGDDPDDLDEYTARQRAEADGEREGQ